jgi:hypothetical protein
MATVSLLFLEFDDESATPEKKERKINKSMLGVDFAIYFLELL